MTGQVVLVVIGDKPALSVPQGCRDWVWAWHGNLLFLLDLCMFWPKGSRVHLRRFAFGSEFVWAGHEEE